MIIKHAVGGFDYRQANNLQQFKMKFATRPVFDQLVGILGELVVEQYMDYKKVLVHATDEIFVDLRCANGDTLDVKTINSTSPPHEHTTFHIHQRDLKHEHKPDYYIFVVAERSGTKNFGNVHTCHIVGYTFLEHAAKHAEVINQGEDLPYYTSTGTRMYGPKALNDSWMLKARDLIPITEGLKFWSEVH